MAATRHPGTTVHQGPTRYPGTLYDRLDPAARACIDGAVSRYRCTAQEVRHLCQAARDLAMWGEPGIGAWWARAESDIDSALPARERKKRLIGALREHLDRLRREPTRYDRPAPAPAPAPRRPPLRFADAAGEAEVFGDCPVRSDRTLCCNLKTIDAVQNCSFGCSYCTIQTFYGDRVTVDRDLGRKLRAIELDDRRFYHIGTGQSSDSLVWGNRGGILDELCRFAAEHPNVLLELKTKSANVSYFLERPAPPPNLVCSWSLNTAAVIEHEEHFTAPLERRLAAARRFADLGRKVAFHFHPMVHYDGWETEYPALAARLIDRFDPAEVAFISQGSVTFIKPVMKRIRQRGEPTRILQADLVADPHGKLTYPDDLKVRMFHTMYRALAPWHGRVFLYLCMEKAAIWDRAFGWRYASNDEFERAFGAATLGWR